MIMNLKEFKNIKKLKPKNLMKIYKLNNYVRLKITLYVYDFFEILN